MGAKFLTLRRPDRCLVCGSELPAGEEGWWDPATRRVTCRACREGSHPARDPAAEPELDRGQAGASLARAYQRRKRDREARAWRAHPRIGGLLLALNGEPQHQRAFHVGDLGEQAVGKSLEQRTAGGPAVILKNRRMPRGRGDIDFLVVAPSGVFVIDAKAINGKVRVATPLFGERKLLVNGRDRTKLIDGLDRQVAAVRDAVGGDRDEVAIQGVLCFTTADLPMLGTLKMRGHLLLYRKALAKRLNAGGPLSPDEIGTVTARLAVALPPA